MNYIDTIAIAIRARVPAELLPPGDTDLLFRLYALLARSKGTEVSASDVHDAWCIWMITSDPDHPSIRPFGVWQRSLRASAAEQQVPYARARRLQSRAAETVSKPYAA